MTYDDEMIARSAIRHVLSVYNSAGDRGKADELSTAFAPDGVLDIGSKAYVGRDAIKAFINEVASGKHPAHLVGARHHLTTSRIDFDSDTTARSWTYFFVMRHCRFLHEGTYIDQHAKVGGQWLITNRRVKIVYDAEETHD